jgi:chitin disaccharide deacetylase
MAAAEKRVLIINGDDLGYTCGVNQGIGDCATAGILRSATLMANGAAFEHAVALAKKHENLDVGVHLVLTKLPAISRHAGTEGLVDEWGCLPGTPGELMRGVLGGRIGKGAIRQELSSQITKILDHGVQPTHLDSHKHVHVFPQVLDVVVELARKYAIPWVRNPFDEIPFQRVDPLVGPGMTATFRTQYLKGRLIRGYRRAFAGRIRKAGLRTPDHFFGIALTGIWTEAAMIELIRTLPSGVSEWMFHPGTCDGDLERSTTRLREQREVEKALLMSPKIQEYLMKQNITLSSFRAEVA